MKKRIYPLNAHFYNLMFAIYYENLKPIVDQLKANKIEEEVAHLFLECCIISIETTDKLLYTDADLEQIYIDWDEKFAHLKRKISQSNRLGGDCRQAIKELVINIIDEKIPGLTMKKVENEISLELAMANTRIGPGHLPCDEVFINHTPLYGPEAVGRFFESFVPEDTPLFRGH